MRLCRFQYGEAVHVGFYDDDKVCRLSRLGAEVGISPPETDSLLDLLPGGRFREVILQIEEQVSPDLVDRIGIPIAEVKILVPIPHPSKLLLLAGNYAKHIEEGGGRAEEQSRTFPYVFMKPPSTTLTAHGDPIRIPSVSPAQIDWELELAVIIGKRCSQVTEADALEFVAGYSIINDISDRAFHPNPNRAERPKDQFFDWLHGKWHDTFCPMGPCVLPATEVADPQEFPMQLKVNGTLEQDASTAEMVFPVAAVIAFVSSFVTLEPGDIISTGTPSGVGKAKGKFLLPGDTVEAMIGGIGRLENPVVG